MISIVIPVYNYQITELVHELHSQAISCNIPFEIIILDDNSHEDLKIENRKLQSLSNTNYTELPQNIGRSKIRNTLAKQAQYPYILFMDCDAKVPNSDFIQKYSDECNGDVVICGGTTYQIEKPQPEYILRWQYGHSREVKKASERNTQPNTSFTTFNFLISKSIFEQITFNEFITMYGHEDTLFGYELKKRNIVIKHIDNPLIHLGLDSNNVFLLKTKQSIETLFSLINNKEVDQHFTEDIRILKMHKKIRAFKLCWFIAILYKLIYKILEHNLTTTSPNMLYFDMFKLGYLCTLRAKSN